MQYINDFLQTCEKPLHPKYIFTTPSIKINLYSHLSTISCFLSMKYILFTTCVYLILLVVLLSPPVLPLIGYMIRFSYKRETKLDSIGASFTLYRLARPLSWLKFLTDKSCSSRPDPSEMERFLLPFWYADFNNSPYVWNGKLTPLNLTSLFNIGCIDCDPIFANEPSISVDIKAKTKIA